jgi:hypothetical protein
MGFGQSARSCWPNHYVEVFNDVVIVTTASKQPRLLPGLFDTSELLS